MIVSVLNTNLDAIAIIDVYESFIWTDRYCKCGDCEIYTAMRDGILDYIKQDYYLQRSDSDRLMIIEKLLIETDVEDGNHITVTGSSLESILKRRIIWGQKTYTGSLQTAIQTMLNECIISPSDSNRQISNFIFESSIDPAITALTIDSQYTGDNLYDVIQKICEDKNIGFKVTFDSVNKQFVFKLYAGVDRSYSQTTVPYVIFSPNFENLLNSNYIESKASMKNVTLIGGEGEGAARTYASVGTVSGLERRELFTDARDISSDVGDGVVLTASEYTAQLVQRGKENLSENINITSFEGEVDTSGLFQYGDDFFMGDIVQISNEYGHDTKVRVLELVTSEDKDGFAIYPTFSTITEEGE